MYKYLEVSSTCLSIKIKLEVTCACRHTTIPAMMLPIGLDIYEIMRKFIFDVDGTITPSRQLIVTEFEDYFIKFAEVNKVFLVTGSDRQKTLEQIGSRLYNTVQKVYQCSGNDVWEQDKNIKTTDIHIPCEMYAKFTSILLESSFPIRTKNHIDIRPGLVNFSIIGRNCTPEQRAEYVEYDLIFEERNLIAAKLRNDFPEYDVQIAGETGIDITIKGKDKSQIFNDFNISDDLFFFGDKMNPNGNDYTLAEVIRKNNGKTFHVHDWRETWDYLKKL
jgi:phosphomannomutase